MISATPTPGRILRLAAAACLAAAAPAMAAPAAPARARTAGPTDSVVVTGAVDTAGTLRATVRVLVYGNRARLLSRLRARGGEAAALQEATSLARGLSPSGQAADVRVLGVSEPDGGYRLEFTASLRRYMEPGRNLQQVAPALPGFPLPAPPESSDQGMLSLGLPHTVVHRLHLTLPPGRVALEARAVADSASFARYAASGPAGGRQVDVVQTLEIRRGLVPPADYDAYRKFSRGLDVAARLPFVVAPERLSDVPFAVRADSGELYLERVGSDGHISGGAAGTASAAFAAGAAVRAVRDTLHRVVDRYPRLDNATDIRRLLETSYPDFAKDRAVGGRTVLWMWVRPDGDVGLVRVIQSSGVHVLDFAAARVAAHMRFRPAMNRGRPVGIWIAQPISFSIRRSF